MLIAGNWKMFKGPAAAAAFCRDLREIDLPADVDVVVCPPYVSLAGAVQALADTEIGVFAQSCHWADEGAFTGEISPAMLLELGVYGTIVGHSERRQMFGETDETVARRTEAALAAGLDVIACVGETEAEREAGETDAVLRRQVSVLSQDESLVIAYEPVWAIGTGVTPTKDDVADVHRFVRERLRARYGDAGQGVRILYGGSVKPANAKALLGVDNVDGTLIGGASLKADEFLAIAAVYR
jgi:triosephosphate isomerase (TIM)